MPKKNKRKQSEDETSGSEERDQEKGEKSTQNPTSSGSSSKKKKNDKGKGKAKKQKKLGGQQRPMTGKEGDEESEEKSLKPGVTRKQQQQLVFVDHRGKPSSDPGLRGRAINRTCLQRVIREQLEDRRMSKEGFALLHEVTESVFAQLFFVANLLAVHSGRTTVHQGDLRFASWITGINRNPLSLHSIPPAPFVNPSKSVQHSFEPGTSKPQRKRKKKPAAASSSGTPAPPVSEGEKAPPRKKRRIASDEEPETAAEESAKERDVSSMPESAVPESEEEEEREEEEEEEETDEEEEERAQQEKEKEKERERERQREKERQEKEKKAKKKRKFKGKKEKSKRKK